MKFNTWYMQKNNDSYYFITSIKNPKNGGYFGFYAVKSVRHHRILFNDHMVVDERENFIYKNPYIPQPDKMMMISTILSLRFIYDL